MVARIMVRAAGGARPLSFDSNRSADPASRSRGSLGLVSSATPWAGLPIEEHRICTYESRGEAGPVDGECGLLVITEGHLDIAARRGGRELRSVVESGSALFVSGDERATRVRMTGSADAVAVRLPSEWFQRLSLDGVPRGFGRSRPITGDRTVLSLVLAMRDEVARGAPTGRLYADSLSLALLSYVVQQRVPRRLDGLFTARGHLSDIECHRLRSYVLDRLGDDLSLVDLASLVGRRPRHFSTLFRQAFGVPPHRYVLRLRLSEGARLLASGDCDMSGIAFRLGFCSQSHFASAFRRAFGVPPSRYGAEKRTVLAVS
jgi:AraC family transcriptional regulator